MIAAIVTVFMNSLRKNRAKRMPEYSVWKPPTKLLFGFDEVERRSVQLGGPGHDEDGERDESGHDDVPVRNDAAETRGGLFTHDLGHAQSRR